MRTAAEMTRATKTRERDFCTVLQPIRCRATDYLEILCVHRLSRPKITPSVFSSSLQSIGGGRHRRSLQRVLEPSARRRAEFELRSGRLPLRTGSRDLLVKLRPPQ